MSTPPPAPYFQGAGDGGRSLGSSAPLPILPSTQPRPTLVSDSTLPWPTRRRPGDRIGATPCPALRDAVENTCATMTFELGIRLSKKCIVGWQ